MTDLQASPPSQDLRGYYAGIVSRSSAFVIDAAILAVVVAMGTWVVMAVFAVLGAELPTNETTNDVIAITVSGGVLVLVYNAGFLALFGKTIGMMIMGVRVVRADGTNPHFWRALVRTMFWSASSILMLGFVWITVDNRRQAWHDKVVGTFVVYDWNAREGALAFGGPADRVVPHG